MSASEDIELLRRGYSAWNRGDVEGVLEIVSDQVELHPVLGDVVLADTFRGHDGMRHWYETIHSSLADFRAEVEDVIEVGDGRYVVLLHFSGRGRASGVEVTLDGAHLVTVRDRLLVRLEGFENREEALRAAGVEERA